MLGLRLLQLARMLVAARRALAAAGRRGAVIYQLRALINGDMLRRQIAMTKAIQALRQVSPVEIGSMARPSGHNTTNELFGRVEASNVAINAAFWASNAPFGRKGKCRVVFHI